ncbi:MAG TPA: tRNA pseudouridine(38-40) synthase TruA [Longimicrobiales bacterium]
MSEEAGSLTGERRFKLTLHYDGAGFFGWQVQPGVRTVQAELEAALSRLRNSPTTVIAAGRTDRGVHATGQVVSATMPAKWSAAELHRALNAILPEDIWISSVEEAPADFHARYDATSRSYIYRIGTVPGAASPFARRHCWALGVDLSLEALNGAARRFLGRHSFRAFAKAGQPERGETCTVTAAEWRPAPGGVEFHVTADRFLHHMVRYMVGTMVDVARGRRPASDIDELLRGTSALETSPPAPPEGLFLSHVSY